MSERNLATVQRFQDAINRGDVADRTAAKWTVNASTTGGGPMTIESIDIYRHSQGGRIEKIWGCFQA